MVALSKRFEAKVDRSGPHHLWFGSKRSDGTGKLKVDGMTVAARRVAWELEHGPLTAGVEVKPCPGRKDCVRVEHLSLAQRTPARPRRRRGRAPKGVGTKVEIRPGFWKLTVTVGRYSDGTRRRVHETVRADGEVEATRELTRFVAEVHAAPLPDTTVDRDIILDDAIERYLTEYLRDEKGREEGTITRYRGVHAVWFSPVIGRRRVRDVNEATMDRIFGKSRPPSAGPKWVGGVAGRAGFEAGGVLRRG